MGGLHGYVERRGVPTSSYDRTACDGCRAPYYPSVGFLTAFLAAEKAAAMAAIARALADLISTIPAAPATITAKPACHAVENAR